MRRLRRNLRKYFHLGGNSISGAIGYAHDELDYQFEKHQRYEDPQRAEQSPEPVAPKRYPVRQPPAHLPTRQYSRKLNRAVKFRDVVEFSNLMKNPPAGLEAGWWVDALASQLVSASGSEDRIEAVQVPMLAALLDSGLPVSDGCFRLALENHNYPMIRMLHARGLAPTPDWQLHRAALWQLLDGHWPHPELWCPQVLAVNLGVQSFYQFFPSENKPNPGAFTREKILRLASLPVSDEFKLGLSTFYGEMASGKHFKFLNTEAHHLALGTLIELGWLDENTALSTAKQECFFEVDEHLRRGKQAKDYDDLVRATAETDLTRSLNRL